MRCWSCARVARRKRTLDSLSEQPPRYRPRYRLRPGLYAACLQPVSAECCKPPFQRSAGRRSDASVPPRACSRQLMVPLFARRWYAACVRSISCWIRCSERIPSVSRAWAMRANSRWERVDMATSEVSVPLAAEPIAVRSWHLRRPCCRGPSWLPAPLWQGLRHCRRYARQRRIRSLARPLLSQLIYIKLRFRQGKRQDLGPAPAEPGCQEHDLQERALAAARQPSPAFQPPAWPRGTPPTVCPSGP